MEEKSIDKVCGLLEERLLEGHYPLVLLDMIKDMVTNTEEVTNTKAPLGQPCENACYARNEEPDQAKCRHRIFASVHRPGKNALPFL